LGGNVLRIIKLYAYRQRCFQDGVKFYKIIHVDELILYGKQKYINAPFHNMERRPVWDKYKIVFRKAEK